MGEGGLSLVLTDFKDGLSRNKIDPSVIDRHHHHLLHESDLQIIVKVVEHKSPQSALSLCHANSVSNEISLENVLTNMQKLHICFL